MRSQVIILIGNKADLEAQRDVTYEEAKQFAEENGECWKDRKRLFLMALLAFGGLMLCAAFHRFAVS